MSAELELVTLARADAGVGALVGVGPAARISADRIQQGAARPFVVYTRTATEPFTSLSGEVFETKVSLDIQCWADTREQAEQLGDALQTAIRGAGQTVVARSGGYEPDLDLEVAILAVEWWE